MEANHSIRFLHSPLKCDSIGNVRILIVGNSGVGKSTIADRLAGILHLPVMHLDMLRWQSNWEKTPFNEFRAGVESFIRDKDSWVIDGNYRKLGDLTTSTATCILWLDPPFLLYFPRLIIRTFLRLIRLSPPCSPGCHERLVEVLFGGKESVLWWAWSSHTPLRQFYTAQMQQPGDDTGKWIRLRGWGKELNAWLKQVENFAEM